MARPGQSKYEDRYAEDLMNGLRRDCRMSIAKVCQQWGITRPTYNKWKQMHPEFRRAAEFAEQDYFVACCDLGWDITEGKVKGGNVGTYTMLMAALHGMSAKQGEKDKSADTTIKSITINVLGPDGKKLKQDNVIDVTPIKPQLNIIKKEGK